MKLSDTYLAKLKAKFLFKYDMSLIVRETLAFMKMSIFYIWAHFFKSSQSVCLTKYLINSQEAIQKSFDFPEFFEVFLNIVVAVFDVIAVNFVVVAVIAVVVEVIVVVVAIVVITVAVMLQSLRLL